MSEWRDVVGYEGLYMVSRIGEIVSLDRLKGQFGSGRRVKGRVMNQRKNHKGYRIVHLSKQGKGKWVLVHRIVANAFIENQLNKPQVNHIDGDKENNCAGNLEWVTGAENARHAADTGLWFESTKKMLNAAHRPEVRKKIANSLKRKVIRSDGIVFSSVEEAAKSVGITHGAVSANIHGKSKLCGGYSFEFFKEEDND